MEDDVNDEVKDIASGDEELVLKLQHVDCCFSNLRAWPLIN